MSTMTEESTGFEVWIGCLACYNAGNLRGQWYPASEAGEVTPNELHNGPGWRGVTEPAHPHEELWVMDTDNAPAGYNREMSPSEAQEVADRLAELGDGGPAYFAYADALGGDLPDVEEFRDAYEGTFETFRDYADELADELTSVSKDADDLLSRYFDYAAFARDLLLGGDYFTEPAPEGGVYVFRSI